MSRTEGSGNRGQVGRNTTGGVYAPDLGRHPKQREFVLSDAPEVAFVGGKGSGKTYGGALKALLYCVANPGASGLVTAPTHDVLQAATEATYFKVFPEEFIAGWRASDRMLTTHNDNVIFFRSTFDYQVALLGMNVAFVHMDEAAISEHESYRRAHDRLRQPGFKPMFWLTSTPRGFNWLSREFPKDGLRPVFFVSTRDNPWVGKDYVARLEAHNPGRLALQEIEGQYTITTGMPFFDIEALELAFRNDVSAPVWQEENGVKQVWKLPALGGRYVVGVDCWGGGMGEESSYSRTEVVDLQTGEQAAMLTGRLYPDVQAAMTVKMCEEYNRAFLVFERNGPGLAFDIALKNLGYGNIYYSDPHRTRPGFSTEGANKETLMNLLNQALRERRIVIHSEADLQEFASFIRDGSSLRAERGAQDDGPMAWAMALVGMQERPYVSRMGARHTSYLVMR